MRELNETTILLIDNRGCNMNEFVGKKIGEVMAFSRVGKELLEKAPSLAGVFGDAMLDNMKAQLQEEYDALQSHAGEQKETAQTKCDATSEKLHKLADTYVGDQWDNPVEVMEWLGFFEGAAIVHCSLVAGAASALHLADLETTATQAKGLHHDALEAVTNALGDVGRERAQA